MSRRFARFPIVFLTVALVASIFVVQGCTTQKADSTDKVADESTTTEQSASPQVPQEGDLYTSGYIANGKEIAVIQTDKGVIKFEFYAKDAPNSVGAFIELAQKGYYDGTKFHRVEPAFVIQGGDPLSKTDDPMVGTGGPGYSLKAEFNSRQHLDGSVAMARSSDPDSAGSQFYICLGPQPFLDGNYTVFGQVIEGMDVVRQIAVGDAMNSVTVENANQ